MSYRPLRFITVMIHLVAYRGELHSSIYILHVTHINTPARSACLCDLMGKLYELLFMILKQSETFFYWKLFYKNFINFYEILSLNVPEIWCCKTYFYCACFELFSLWVAGRKFSTILVSHTKTLRALPANVIMTSISIQ